MPAAALRYGLLGYGAWGRHHANAIRDTPGCELRAVYARSESSRKAAKDEAGCEVYDSFAELIANAEVDVVDIVLPNHLHEAAAVAAFDKDKHVLLEKPMSTSVGSCDRIERAATKSGRLLLVGHEMRFSPMYAAIRKLIGEGRIGEPRYVLIDLWRRPYRSGADGWRLDPSRVGNWILEEPIHYFDLAAWYLENAGEPASVYAFGNNRAAGARRSPAMNDHFTAVLTYPNGAYAAVSQSLSAVEHHFSLKVFGTLATLRAEWHAELDRSERPAYSLEISEGDRMTTFNVAGVPGELFELRMEIEWLTRAVREGGQLPITPREGRRAVMLCLEAARSLETGQVVTLGGNAAGVSTAC